MSENRSTVQKLSEFLHNRVARPLAEKAQAWGLRDKLQALLPKDLAKKLPQQLDAAALLELGSGLVQQRKLGFYGRMLTAAAAAFFLADIAALVIDNYIPAPPLTRSINGFGSSPRRRPHAEDFAAIWGRNLVNSKGIIPGEEQQLQDDGGTPIRTTLPFNLVGTVILEDEFRSIATIEDKTAALVYPVRVDDEIPSKAKITKIESNRVYFTNLGSRRREFVDIPDDPSLLRSKVGIKSSATLNSSGPGIEKVSENQYNVSKNEVDAALKDFNKVLTQARAIPVFENGLPAGYKLVQIEPGSIYAKLGIQENDIITSVNGEAVTDPAKAFQLLNTLREGPSNLELGIKRGGVTKNTSYTIH